MLTVLTVVFGLWYKDISDALSLADPKASEPLDDKVAERETLRIASWSRLGPLTLGSLVITVTFLPVAYRLTRDAIQGIAAHGISFASQYDAVQAALWVAWVFMFVLVCYLVRSS